jgi:hypothetical protein
MLSRLRAGRRSRHRFSGAGVPDQRLLPSDLSALAGFGLLGVTLAQSSPTFRAPSLATMPQFEGNGTKSGA